RSARAFSSGSAWTLPQARHSAPNTTMAGPGKRSMQEREKLAAPAGSARWPAIPGSRVPGGPDRAFRPAAIFITFALSKDIPRDSRQSTLLVSTVQIRAGALIVL